MRLLLFRHAKSSWPSGVQDHERPLGPRGRRASALIGRFIADKGFRPDLVVVSTARRTRETWERAALAFPGDLPRRDESRIYEAAAAVLLEVIRDTPVTVGSLMLVGHNPGFEELAEMLVGAGKPEALARMREKFPTAALAVIELDLRDWKDVAPGLGELKRFDTPKSVEARMG